MAIRASLTTNGNQLAGSSGQYTDAQSEETFAHSLFVTIHSNVNMDKRQSMPVVPAKQAKNRGRFVSKETLFFRCHILPGLSTARAPFRRMNGSGFGRRPAISGARGFLNAGSATPTP
jgi:hypothetical protein